MSKQQGGLESHNAVGELTSAHSAPKVYRADVRCWRVRVSILGTWMMNARWDEGGIKLFCINKEKEGSHVNGT